MKRLNTCSTGIGNEMKLQNIHLKGSSTNSIYIKYRYIRSSEIQGYRLLTPDS